MIGSSSKVIAQRIAAVQLLCSRWGLESYWSTLQRQHRRLPADIQQRLLGGIQSVQECIDHSGLELSPDETLWLKLKAGQWAEQSADTREIMEGYWEALGTLLWSLHIFPNMKQPWIEFPRQETYTLTGIVPSRPTSIDYWIRSFDLDDDGDMSNVEQRRYLRSLEEIQMEHRRSLFWLWRSNIYMLDSIKKHDMVSSQSKLRRVLENIPKGISGAAHIGITSGVLSVSADSDFAVNIGREDSVDILSMKAYRDLDKQSNTLIKRLSQGRALALSWLMKGGDIKHWDISQVQGVNALSNGVQAIWTSGTDVEE